MLWFPIVRSESRADLADIEPRRFDLFVGQGTHQPPQDAPLPEPQPEDRYQGQRGNDRDKRVGLVGHYQRVYLDPE